jgi:Pyruvate/2-oxoacid:ferredoxin oxidoreductase gamma subunit
MTGDDRLLVLPLFAGAKTQAQVTVIDPSQSPLPVPRTNTTLAVLAAVLKQLALFPPQALEEATRLGPKQYVDENLKAIAAGFALADL